MIRDEHSNALISTDRKELDKYRLEKMKVKRVENLEGQVSDIQIQLSQILKILREIKPE